MTQLFHIFLAVKDINRSIEFYTKAFEGTKVLYEFQIDGFDITMLGLGNGPTTIDMNTVISKGLTLQGISGRKMDNWHQMSYMVQGGLDVTPIITHRYHYTDFQKGFDAMLSGNSGKVVLDWTTKED